MIKNKNLYKKIALILSLCLIAFWAILGTGASLAWFTDTSEEVKNIFHVAEFDLVVSHRLEDGTYEEIDGQTKIFDDEALYEPGYVQVVYLKIENRGTVPFDCYTAVNVNGATTATNVFGQQFWLHDYLKFGVAFASTEAVMDDLVSEREKAEEIATMKLQNYDTDVVSLAPGEVAYLALVVRMPQEVGNEANYRGGEIPKVELGLIIKAEQQK